MCIRDSDEAVSNRYGFRVSFAQPKKNGYFGESYASYFYKVMNTNKVANEKHFQVKATIYQKHFEKPYIGLEARIKEFESEFECCDGIEQCYRCDNNEALVETHVIRTKFSVP